MEDRRLSPSFAQQAFWRRDQSHTTPKSEKQLAPHPSLKPQAFLRAIVRAALPLGQRHYPRSIRGFRFDARGRNAIGYDSIGIEKDAQYVAMARIAIPKLACLTFRR